MSAQKLLWACLAASGVVAACSSSSPDDTAVATLPVDPRTGLRLDDLGPVPPLPEWPDNPPTDSKRALGKALFSDARLSGSGKTSCANCHFPLSEFQSGGPKDAPDRSYPAITPTLGRNTPSLLNLVYAPMMRWDGSHFTDLVDMGVLPFAEANMNLTPGISADRVEDVDVPAAQHTLYERLTRTVPGYVALFRDAFGEDLEKLGPEQTWRLAGKAIVVYLRLVVSRDSAFDRWNAGDDTAMNAAAVRGFELFRGPARCIGCHSGPFFTDFRFHNAGVSALDASGKRDDEGRYRVTHAEADRGAFLTPTLRSVALTSPYLHDGSEVSLAKVIERKTTPEILKRDPNHDRMFDGVRALTARENADLVEFLKALTGAPLPIAELSTPPKLP